MIDTRLPLMVQQPNILAALDAGTQAAGNQANLMRQAEGQNIFRQYGAGAMQGDQNALAAIAGFDPAMGLNMMTTQRENARADARLGMDRERLSMLRDQTARALAEAEDQAAAAREAAEFDRYGQAAIRAHAAGDAAAFKALTSEIFGQPLPFSQEGLAALAAAHEGAKAYLGNMPKPMSASDRYKTVGGQLVDLQAEGGPAPVPGIDGRSAGTSFEFDPQSGTFKFSEGGPAVLDQAGLKSGSGQTRVSDPTSPTGTRVIAEPGSEAAQAEQDRQRAAEAAAENARTRVEVVTKTTQGIRNLLKDKGFWNRVVTADLPEAGIFGERVRGVSQERVDLEGRIDTLKGMVAFDRLEKMKAASSTGASGLGQVTEREISLLAAQLGALDANLSPEVIRETLNTVESVFGKLTPEAQAYLLGTSDAEPWAQGAQPAQGGGFASATMQDLMSVDLGTLPADQLDAWERRLNQLQGQQ